MAATERIVTELVIDARLAKEGADTYAKAMNSAAAAMEKQSAQMTGLSQHQARYARQWQNIQQAMDPTLAVHAKMQQAIRAADAEVRRGIISQDEAARSLTRYRREIDGTAAAERKFASDLDAVRGALDRTHASQARLAQQQAVLNQALRQGQISASDYGRMMQQANAQAAGGQEQVSGGMGMLMALGRQLGPVMAAAFSVAGVMDLGRQIVTAGDQVAMLAGRFTALSGSAAQGQMAVQQVFDIASKTGASVDGVGQAFSRFYLASKSLGATQEEAARLVETVGKLGAVGGASASEVANGSIQLAQALASGVLRGDELNSILENLPLVARQIAEGLGVSIGQLRTMGSEGQLTADKVFGALQKGAAQADQQFAQLPVTVERAAGEASVAWTRFLNSLNDSIGLTKVLAAGLQGIANILNNLSKPATNQNIAAGLVQQIANLERIRDQQRAGGLEGLARQNDANIANLQQALSLTQEMALQESRLTAQRGMAEQAAADEAKAQSQANAALKEQVAARKELDKVLSDLDPRFKNMKTFSETVMGLDKALSEGNLSIQDHTRYLGLAVKAYDEAEKKAAGLNKKIREEKISFDSLNQSVKDATAVALEHERRLAAGSKEFEAIIKADDALADSLTKRFMPAAQKASAEMQTLDRLLRAGSITQEVFAAATAEINRNLEESDPAFKAAQQAAARYREEVDRAIGRSTDRIVDFGADALFDTLTGKTKDFWKSFTDMALRAFSQIAAEALLRPIVLPMMTNAVTNMPGLFGLAGSSTRTGSSGASGGIGVPSFSIGGADVGGLVGDAFRWANTPFANIGGSQSVGSAYYGAEATFGPGSATPWGAGGAGGASGMQGGISFTPMDIIGPLASALPGIISGNFIQAGLGAGGFALGNFLLPGIGGPIGGFIGNLVGSLFGKKPSNMGAESSFTFDQAGAGGDLSFDRLYRGDKHASSLTLVDNIADAGQRTLDELARRYSGVEFGGTVSARYGKKEGASISYGAPDAQSVDDWQVFTFDPEDKEQMAQAFSDFSMAALKSADWSGLGETVATAVQNSTATDLEGFLADVEFGRMFDPLVELGTAALDPVALALRAVGESGRKMAADIKTGVDDFREKIADLKLGTEELADGTTKADAATRGYVLTTLGLGATLDPVTAATAEYEAFMRDLLPILTDVGFKTEEIGQIQQGIWDDMVGGAIRAREEIARQMTALAIDIRTGIEQTINPAFQMSSRDLFAGQGLDTTQYARLLGLVSAAATGDEAALREMGNRLIYNLDPDNNPSTAGYITQAQADAIRQYAQAGYTRAVAPQAGGYLPANDNGSSTSSGGGSGGGSSNDGARQAIQDQIDSLQDLARIQNDAAREAERMANAFKGAADSLRLYRLGLLTDPSNNPASLGDQLAEAQRQQAAALARVLAGGADAPDAARELQQVSSTVLSLGKQVFGSSPQYVALFDRTIGMITQAEQKTATFETQQLALAATANAELARLNGQIEGLRGDLSALGSSSGGGTSGGGGGGGGGSTPTTPGAGYYLDSAGKLTQIRFGMQSLGRGANESVVEFMKGFASYTGAATEEAAYAWMLQAHPSGLAGLDRLEYFAAARQAGFPMNLDFGGTDHLNWLNASTDGTRWKGFIDKLRQFTTVPPGFFAGSGAPAGYALGGLVTGGVAGRDSVPAMLMPGERVFSVPHSRIIEGLAAGRSGPTAAEHREVVHELRKANAAIGIVAARLAQIDQGTKAGNATREEMHADAKAARAGRAPKVGSAPPLRRAV